MKKEDLFYALGDVSEDLLQMAEEKKFGSPWKRWAPLAACLALVVGIGLLSLPQPTESEAPKASMYTADMECAVEEFAVAEEAPAEAEEKSVYTAEDVQIAFENGDHDWILETFVRPYEDVGGLYVKQVSVDDNTALLLVGHNIYGEKQYKIQFNEDGWECVEISTPE